MGLFTKAINILNGQKIIKETDNYVTSKDNVGFCIECKSCGLQSYDPEHLKANYCPNCGLHFE